MHGYIHACTYIHACIHTCNLAEFTHTIDEHGNVIKRELHTYLHTHTHTHMYAHIHTCMYTHMQFG